MSLVQFFEGVGTVKPEVIGALEASCVSVSDLESSDVDKFKELLNKAGVTKVQQLSVINAFKKKKEQLEERKKDRIEEDLKNQVLQELGLANLIPNFKSVKFIEQLLCIAKNDLKLYELTSEQANTVFEKLQMIKGEQKFAMNCFIYSKLKENGIDKKVFPFLKEKKLFTVAEVESISKDELNKIGITTVADLDSFNSAVAAMKIERENDTSLYKESIQKLDGLISPLKNIMSKASSTASNMDTILSTKLPSMYKGEVLMEKINYVKNLAIQRSGMRVCVTGSMKAGKSTLLNCLIKDSALGEILPTDKERCTARPTILRYAEEFKFHVGLTGDVKISTSKEECKKEIELDEVRRQNKEELQVPVVVYLNSELLRVGIELIDLPGKNESEEMDSIVDSFLENVDAIIYMFDPSGEWTTADKKMVMKIQNINSEVPLLIVASKFDLYEMDPRDKSKTKNKQETHTSLNNVYMQVKEDHFGMKNYDTENDFTKSKFFKLFSIAPSKFDIRKEFMNSLEELLGQRIEPMKNDTVSIMLNALRNMLCLLNSLFDENEQRIEGLKQASNKIFEKFSKEIDTVFETYFRPQIAQLKLENKQNTVQYLQSLKFGGTEGQGKATLREALKNELEIKFCHDLIPVCENTEAKLQQLFDSICNEVFSEIDCEDSSKREAITEFQALTKLFQVNQKAFSTKGWKTLSKIKWAFVDKFTNRSKDDIIEELYEDFQPETAAVDSIREERKSKAKILKDFITSSIKTEQKLIDDWKANITTLNATMKQEAEAQLLAEWIYYYQLSCPCPPVTIGSKVGSGQFGNVCLATINGTNENLAVKLVDAEKLSQVGSSLTDCFREVFFMNYFNNIGMHVSNVRFVQMEENNRLSIFMDYYSKGTLKQQLPHLSNLHKLLILTHVLGSISDMHIRSIAHRDIKLENILLDENMIPYLADFGVSKATNISRRTFVGTPGKLDPSMLKEEKKNYIKYDTYSSGVMINDIQRSIDASPSKYCEKIKEELTAISVKAKEKTVTVLDCAIELRRILQNYLNHVVEFVPELKGPQFFKTFLESRKNQKHYSKEELTKALLVLQTQLVQAQVDKNNILLLFDTIHSVKKLQFVNCKFALKEFEKLCEVLCNSTVEELHLRDVVCEDGIAKNVCKLVQKNSHLTHLDLSWNSLSSTDVQIICKGLSSNSTLTHLNFNGNNIDSVGFESIAALLKEKSVLQSLNFSNNVDVNSSLKKLDSASSSSDSLSKLKMDRRKSFKIGFFKDSTVKKEKVTPFLAIEEHGTNELGIAGAKAFSEMFQTNTSLHTLILTGVQISDEIFQTLVENIPTNTTLKKLIVNHNQISDASGPALEKLLSSKSLQCLDLSNNSIKNAGCGFLAKGLIGNSCLQILLLRNNSISSVGLGQLTKSLKQNSKLQKLDLSENELGNDGLIELFHCLHNNRELKYLVLDAMDQWKFSSDVQTMQDGCIIIAEALKKNSCHITHLSLRNNNINSFGSGVIADALTLNTSLQVLDLTRNKVTDDAAAKFFKNLWRKQFSGLSLAENTLGEVGCSFMAELLNSNASIKEVNISNNLSEEKQKLFTAKHGNFGGRLVA